MKIIQSLAILTLAGFLTISCKENTNETKSIVVASNAETIGKLETASFTISGMSCAVMCANKIEKELSAMDGVKKATVDFDKKLATVQYDSSKLSPEKLIEKVEAVADGKTYKVSNLKTSANKAMLFGDPEKEKRRAEKKAKKEADKKAKNSKSAEKPGCCAAKKHCAMDEKGTL